MPALVFKRVHIFEFNDQPWLPESWRFSITDAIALVARLFNSYRWAMPVLAEALTRSGDTALLDLGSGSGGQVLDIRRRLAAKYGMDVTVILTDKYPSPHLRPSGDDVTWHAAPVDATAVPADLPGFRTLFTSFHHFPPDRARRILLDAAQNRRSIGVFEYTDRNLLRWIFPTLFTPLTLWLITPFIRPLSFRRFLFTYLLPVVPLMATWDCLVSGLRTYLPEELMEMTRDIGAEDYEWRAGKTEKGAVTYLVGVPREGSARSWVGRFQK
jgi:hypothetical protein